VSVCLFLCYCGTHYCDQPSWVTPQSATMFASQSCAHIHTKYPVKQNGFGLAVHLRTVPRGHYKTVTTTLNPRHAVVMPQWRKNGHRPLDHMAMQLLISFYIVITLSQTSMYDSIWHVYIQQTPIIHTTSCHTRSHYTSFRTVRSHITSINLSTNRQCTQHDANRVLPTTQLVIAQYRLSVFYT